MFPRLLFTSARLAPGWHNQSSSEAVIEADLVEQYGRLRGESRQALDDTPPVSCTAANAAQAAALLDLAVPLQSRVLGVGADHEHR